MSVCFPWIFSRGYPSSEFRLFFFWKLKAPSWVWSAFFYYFCFSVVCAFPCWLGIVFIMSFIYLFSSYSAPTTVLTTFAALVCCFTLFLHYKKVLTVSAIVWFTLSTCPCCTEYLSGTVSVYIVFSTISTSTLIYMRTNVQFMVFHLFIC